MKNQELLDAIRILSGSIEPLVIAEKKEAIIKVVEKILELVNKL